MKSRFLFPAKARLVGVLLFLIGIAFFWYTQQTDKQIFVWRNIHFFLRSLTNYDPDECFDNEIQLALILAGLSLIAFAKEKVEDEHIVQLRLESLQWAVYVNYLVFFIIIFAVYGLSFLFVTMYNVLTLLVVFIIRFRWKIFLLNRNLQQEVREATS